MSNSQTRVYQPSFNYQLVRHWLLAFQCEYGTIPLATCHHYKLLLITFSRTFFPFNLLSTPLDHEDQRLWLKNVKPVMYDNLFTANTAHWLSTTQSISVFSQSPIRLWMDALTQTLGLVQSWCTNRPRVVGGAPMLPSLTRVCPNWTLKEVESMLAKEFTSWLAAKSLVKA